MLTASEIAAIVETLAPALRGGQAQSIREPSVGTLVLRVRRPQCTTHLVLSAAQDSARVARASAQGPTLPEPSHIGRWLRARLKGRRVLDLTALPGERVVVLHFEAGQLVVELTGRSANLYGLDERGRVQVSLQRPNDARDLRPGRVWVPPPPQPERTARPARPEYCDPDEVERIAQRQLAVQSGQSQQDRRAAILGRVRRRLQTLHRKVSADVARSEGAERWQRMGELLKSQQHLAQRGQTQVEVTDWYAPDTPRCVLDLDPALDAAQNVERFFARYRKAKSGQVRAVARLAEVETQLADFEAICAQDLDEAALIEALQAADLWRSAPQRVGRHKPAVRRPYRSYLSSQGARILVGRGGVDNHALSFQVARGRDWWLHVRDVPGAHVVLPSPTGAAPSPETLLDAAALAVRHSELKDEPHVEVTVTQRKYIRAVPGSPGRVMLLQSSTVAVQGAAARAQGLRRAPEEA